LLGGYTFWSVSLVEEPKMEEVERKWTGVECRFLWIRGLTH